MATKFSDEPKTNTHTEVDLDRIAQGVRLILEGLGEDPERAGLQETPRRVAEMFAELTAGMREDPHAHVVPLPGDKHDEMVIVKDISIASLCEHHLARSLQMSHRYIPKTVAFSGFRSCPTRETFSRRCNCGTIRPISRTPYKGLTPVGVWWY